MLTRALSGRYQIASRASLAQEARRRGLNLATPAGRSIAARALRVAALVSGTVVRVGGQWVFRGTVFSGHSGRPVGNASIPLRAPRLDTVTARRVAMGLAPPIARARTGPPPAGRVAARVSQRPSNARRTPNGSRRPPAGGDFDDGTEAATESEGDVEPGPAGGAESHPPAREVAPPPPVAETQGPKRVGESLGFEVDEASGRAGGREAKPSAGREKRPKRPSTEPVKRQAGRRDYESAVEISAGAMLLSRSFDFNDPIEPAQPSNYRSGFVAALQFDGAVYPFALFGGGPLAGVGLVGSYYFVPALKSTVTGGGDRAPTTVQQGEGGLRYRWNILGRATSPTLKAGVSFGRLAFVIKWSTAVEQIPLPNVTYVYLKLALLGLEVPFYRTGRFSVGGTLSFDYLFVFSAGEIERTDAPGYGKSSTQGIDVGGGLYANYAGFFLRAGGFYRRMFLAFTQKCYEANTGCRAAGGAIDIYQGGTLLLGYGF
jgi:hypothetical protein